MASTHPEHYLFSFRLNRVKKGQRASVGNAKYDPTRPATRWFLRKSWDKLRKATGFQNLNPHDSGSVHYSPLGKTAWSRRRCGPLPAM